MHEAESKGTRPIIPNELCQLEQWVGWRSEERHGKPTKVPIDPKTGRRAKTNDATTWGTYDEACQAVERYGLDGIGFVLIEGGGIIFIDLDRCRNPETGELAPWAQELVDRLNSYAEVSPSGSGIHIFVKGDLPLAGNGTGKKKCYPPGEPAFALKPGDTGNAKSEIEFYRHGRYATVTGNHIPNTPLTVERRQEQIDELWQTVFSDRPQRSNGRTKPTSRDGAGRLSDDELLDVARKAKNGAKFRAMYDEGDLADYDGDHSRADLALCHHLAYYSGKDAGRMDRLFRRSKLMRPKWDNAHRADGATYGHMTIEKAIDETTDVWNPKGGTEASQLFEVLEQDLAQARDRQQARGVVRRAIDDEFLDALGVVADRQPSRLERFLFDLNDKGIAKKDCEKLEGQVRHRRAEQRRRIRESARVRQTLYRVDSGVIVHVKDTKEGPVPTPLCNFRAQIVTECIHDDGVENRTHLEIEGTFADDRPLPLISVPAEQFGALGWVTKSWGTRAIVYAGFATKDHLRAAIQLLSHDVAHRHVFTHTGWRKLGQDWCYLHAGGAIDQSGLRDGVEVRLPDALSRFDLVAPREGEPLVRAIRASLGLLEVAPHSITIPLLGAVYCSVLGGSDFALHLAGPTGAGKSELAALVQQHFGAAMDSRHLPASWSSTGNALEGLAFQAKDAILVIDDFAPTGSTYDVQRYHREADRILRAQGNRAGRQRMRSDATLKPAKPPRGLILSTGEDVPLGQSLRARLMTLELGPNDLDWERLSGCQADARNGTYAQALAAYLQWLAPRYEERLERRRTEVRELREEVVHAFAHRRAPEIVANLASGLRLFLEFAESTRAITPAESEQLWEDAWNALEETAAAQAKHQAASEPTRRFLELIGAAIASGQAHVASPEGDKPEKPKAWGWREIKVGTGVNLRVEWRPQGTRVGWLDEEDLYLEPDASHAAAQGIGGKVGDPLSVTPQTLRKRLRERGLLVSAGASEGRDTLQVRRTLEGRRRSVLHLHAGALSTLAKPDRSKRDPVTKDAVGLGDGQAAGQDPWL